MGTKSDKEGEGEGEERRAERAEKARDGDGDRGHLRKARAQGGKKDTVTDARWNQGRSGRGKVAATAESGQPKQL